MPQAVVFGHTHTVVKPPRSGPFGWAWDAQVFNTGGFMNDVEKVSAVAVAITDTGMVDCLSFWP